MTNHGMQWTGRLVIVLAGLLAWPGSGQAQQLEITGKDGAPMVLVPAGEFTMGSNEGEADEKPEHRVNLNAFYMDKYEVTVGQYAAFLQATGFDPPQDWETMNQPPHLKRPVVMINWEDAALYCIWAGKRLPTEAEWEKAARGTDGRIYPWGNEAPTRLHANFARIQWNNHATLVPAGCWKMARVLMGSMIWPGM